MRSLNFVAVFFHSFFGSPQFMILVAANVTIVKRGSRIIIVLRCNFTLNCWYSTSKLRVFYYLKSSMQSHLYIIFFFLRKKRTILFSLLFIFVSITLSFSLLFIQTYSILFKLFSNILNFQNQFCESQPMLSTALLCTKKMSVFCENGKYSNILRKKIRTISTYSWEKRNSIFLHRFP